MDTNDSSRMGFWAQINDTQSLKKNVYLDFLKDEKNLENILSFLQNAKHIDSGGSSEKEKMFNVISKKYEKSQIDDYFSIINSYNENKIQTIKYTDKEFPQKLLKIKNPPYLLYCKGDVNLLNEKLISVIGTRNISENGKIIADKIVTDLVNSRYVIVSGLAKGTDSVVHSATLAAKGKTIAVLPGSITKILPASNKKLGENISNTGLVISEITERVVVHKGRFIERNRITSGISEAVVVIESGEKGGSIRQAEIAIEQGKPVFVVTADERNTDAYPGYKKLISIGAIGVDSADQILHHLENLNSNKKKKTKTTTFSDF